jgi:o-succinylbenzoate synthase
MVDAPDLKSVGLCACVGSSPTTPILYVMVYIFQYVMVYIFQCRPYRRPFLRPLVTSRGPWAVREGVILCLQTPSGDRYWGEIAPLPQFGSETLGAALEFCAALPQEWDALPPVPDRLPATQFAFSTLLSHGLGADAPLAENIYWSALLPAGAAALDTWPDLWQRGYRTFKWKIGTEAIELELAVLAGLMAQMPPTVRLRLDGNGGLSLAQTRLWLERCALYGSQIEFLEQPGDHLPTLLDLAATYSTPLALDEMVSSPEGLVNCYRQGWRGIYVIKPAIGGDGDRLGRFLTDHQLDVVCSSSLETSIGQTIVQRWARQWQLDRRSPGLGVSHWFAAKP